MPHFEEFYFASTCGSNNIRVQKCVPDAAPKAVVQIAHGIAEHVERYGEFMSFLAENGYVVVANDHLGHGKSIGQPDEQGFFAEENGWDYVVSDMAKLHDLTQKDYPDIPYILFGHSMGSFLTRTYLIKYPGKYDAAIISGTGQQSKALVVSGYAMARAAVALYGPKKLGEKLNGVAFGTYNKDFQPERTPFDWLSRDEAIVDKYIADPLCGFVATVSLFRDMMGGIRFISEQKNIDKMSKTQPIYFMSGACDPVGENGKGVKRAYNAFCRAGLKDVMIRLYPEGRHEMLNELNKADVYRDILNWLDEKVAAMR